MIKKIERVSKKLFQEIFSKGGYKHSPIFSAKIAPSNDGVTRFAVVVPKTVFKKAHDRNRIRRIFYASIKDKDTKVIKNRVYIFICKKEISKYDKSDIQEEVRIFFNTF